jgi:hypothetical protein
MQPAETTKYLIMGLVVILGTIGVYAYSLYARFQNLKRDKDLLDEE